MKRIKYFLVLLAAILSMGIATNVKADDGGYTIKDYKFNGVYHADNTMDVKETITVDFYESRHGIYRSIPIYMYVNRKCDDNKDRVLTYKNDISNIRVNYPYDTEEEDDNKILKIGSSFKKVKGIVKYEISYTLTMPNDRVKKSDVLYYSVLGNGWNTTIDNFEFNVKYEKPISQGELEKLSLYSGNMGDENNNLNVTFVSEKDKIYGVASNIPKNKAITFYAEVKEGYFKFKKNYTNTIPTIFFWITIVVAILAIIYLLFRKDKKIVETVEFYPPNNFSPAEVGMIFDAVADDEDLVSLIPYWGQKKYLRIEEVTDGKKKKNLVLYKLKDLEPDAPEYQRILFNALFTSEKRSLKKLPNSFASKFESSKASLDWDYKKLNVRDGAYKGSLMAIVLGILYGLMLLTSSQVDIFENIVLAVFGAVPVTAIGIMRVMGRSKDINRTKGKWVKHIFLIVLMIIISSVGILVLSDENHFSVERLLGINIIVTVAMILAGRFEVYTDEGARIIGQLKGLKTFIKTAELSRLEVLNNENPEYYYDVLPYAMVFGLSDHWAKQFKSLSVKAPLWYSSDDMTMFSCMYLTHNIMGGIHDSVNTCIQQAKAAQAKSSSSGGFSGGGGGGGGGGSW